MLRLEFKPQDMWVGAYWRKKEYMEGPNLTTLLDMWVCIVPMLPIHYRHECQKWVAL